MQILVNGNEGLLEAEPGVTLKVLLDQLGAWARSEQLAIVETSLDGNPIDREHLDQDIAEFTTLELQVTGSVPLVTDTVGDLLSALVNFKLSHEDAARLIQQGAMEPGLALVQQILETWQAVASTAQSATRLMSRNPIEVGEASQKLNVQITQLAEAVGRGDTVAISDVLEYELAPAVDPWKTLLQTMSKSEDPPSE